METSFYIRCKREQAARERTLPVFAVVAIRLDLIVGPGVEPPGDLFGVETVDEGFGVGFADVTDGVFGFFRRHHRIQHLALFALVTAHAGKLGGVVVGVVPDDAVHFLGMVGNHQKCLFLVALVKHMENLGACKLEDDRV